jgi:integrase
MQAITNETLAEFVAKRRLERGLKPGSKVSPATINKELRVVRRALRIAKKWDYVTRTFDFGFLRQYEKHKGYVTPEHFGLLYAACDHATLPENLPYPPADWWRGLLVLAYMTGWRIGQLLAFRRTDLDFATGEALTRAEENKGKRDQRIPLHGLVLDHLQKLASFEPVFLPWYHNRRRLYKEFERIQSAGGVKPAGDKPSYTFHDFRRGFATMNADRMTGEALQAHMQHRDRTTTQKYIDLARQLRPAMENLFVPTIPKAAGIV